MKALTLLALAGFSCMAAAEGRMLAMHDTSAANAERYDYSMDLDIARVIRTDEIPEVCAVVPIRMVYEDSRGEQHTIEYSVMGRGCGGF
ncbi:DUF2790 domain-containing protein [Azotobacter chroococcum subsp. isscasi]|uniref:DUF2790 domain-containing protein n=1 Tax=Azotobacter chroococcum TaxID=353 RepID=UPI00103CF793|nr:DUF2790 domain-containing protein [Azotobacter chroococcum]TBW07080.1 DUF2790 domain-containing protein [Azotobacter chroococcum subsp. isscasi]